MATATAALFSSESQTWLTPKVVLDRVLAFEPRGIELDPFGNAESVMGARRQYLIENGEDGFALPWPDLGLVWVNPPFDQAERAAAKCAAEAARHVEIMLLLPARTDTKTYQRHIFPHAAALCFWRGRMEFLAGREPARQGELFGGEAIELDDGDNTAPFPTCISYFGTRPRAFQRAFEPAGWTVTIR